jgi:virulence factor Mce-like protein
MRRRRWTPFRAGLAALALAALAVYLAFGGALPWESTYELRAVVSSGSELHSRTPVRIAGVDVGKVADVKRGPGATAIVTMDLDDKALPIHSDATLKVRPRIFLEGNFFVELRQGTPSAPTVDSGYTIPISQTAIPVQLDQILSSLQRPTRDNLVLLVHELGSTLDRTTVRAVHDTIPKLAPTFRLGAIAAEAVRGQNPHDLSGFILDAERTARALASRRAELANLVSGLDRTAEALAARRAELSASLPELAGLIREAHPTLVAVNRLLPTTRALARELRPGLRAAPGTLKLANPLLTQLTGLLGPAELPALIDVLDPTVRALARLQPRLRTVTKLLYPVTECVRRNVLPTVRTPVPDGKLSTGDAPYAELFHGWVGLASAVQNFDGDGHAVRYHAGFGNQVITTGPVSGLTEPLVGVTENPLLGSRPKPPAQPPPIRGDVACISQKRPNLNAATGAAEKTKQLP